MVKIKLYGKLGEAVKSEWNLHVNSVSEAIHAININTKKALQKFLLAEENIGDNYKIVINGKDYKKEEHVDWKDVNSIKKSGLFIKKNLQSIDIVPVIEGAEDFIQIIAGALLIIIGILTFKAGGGFLIGAGIGLLAGGVIQLLTKPPKFEDFREIDGATGRTSYLFNGPQNTTREGGPVPIVYGRLLIGSQVISASYNILEKDAGIQRRQTKYVYSSTLNKWETIEVYDQ